MTTRLLPRALIITCILVLCFPLHAYAQTIFNIKFPVAGDCSFSDTFGAARDGGKRSHEGIDIMGEKMTPLAAAVDGTIDWLNDGVETSTANGLPYYQLMLRGDDGNDYFYLHINNDTLGTDDGLGGIANAYAPGIVDGAHVSAGQTIAYLGDSGNAENSGSHLHFEIHQNGYKNPINPYYSLILTRDGKLFSDVTIDVWYFDQILNLLNREIVSGYDDNTFRPDNPVSRVEFIKMVSLAAGLSASTTYQHYFPDVPEDFWGWKWIEAVKDAGIITGGKDGMFRPDEPITRAEAAKILAKAGQVPENTGGSPFMDVDCSFWCYTEIMSARSAGIINGYTDGSFKPLNKISRAEATKMINSILK